MKAPWTAAGLAALMAMTGTWQTLAQEAAAAPAEDASASTEAPAQPAEVRSADQSRRTVDPAIVAADALVVRPVGFAATVVGAAIYVVALPFAAISGDVKSPGKSLVGAPASFTFRRKLGDFDTPSL